MSISRWSSYVTELRHSWPVRFAHHPLCARHRHETWQIGSAFLCRGCVSLFFGLAVGTASVLVVPGGWSAYAAMALTPIVLGFSWPRRYTHLPRVVRDLLRVALGLLISIGSFVVFSAPMQLWPILPAMATLWWWYQRERRRVKARRCDACPELGKGICSGFARQAEAMRAIEAELEARLELSGTGDIERLFQRKVELAVDDVPVKQISTGKKTV